MIFTAMPIWYWLCVSGIFGAISGSFFNVLIVRMPRGQSLLYPGSHCPKCNYKIRWWQNIPIFSYLVLQGKCFNCKSKIPFSYLLVELLSAVISMAACYIILEQWVPIKYALGFYILCLYTLPIIIIDIKHFLIPDVLTFSGTLFAFIEAAVPGGKTILQVVLGWGIAVSGFWLLGYLTGKIVHKEALGLGDVKLLGMIGAFFGLQNTLFCIFFAALCGCLTFFCLLLLGKFKRENPLPFGPFLCLGALCAAVWGDAFLHYYTCLISRLI